MRPSQARFVTACQQLLALAVVLVVLAPAAGVARLDVVDRLPGGSPTVGDLRVAPGTMAFSDDSATESSEVETAPVDAELVEHQLTTPGDGRPARSARPGASRESATSGTVLSKAEPVTGYGAVGVTWGASQRESAEGSITVSVRTRTGSGAWTAWDEMEHHDEHAPDPGTAEAESTRPGTEPVFVGEVDEVQVRARTADGAVPADMKMSVVGPGESAGMTEARPELGGDTGGDTGADQAATEELATSDGDVRLQAASGATRPTIYSRKQWGADERLRSGSPSYGTIKGGFVHHTVNANDYTKAQVPGMLRSIYAYHTRSRGWSDVGYNFLVDKFGRIWEGRAGGVTRPVVGAHTLGYNGESFAMSAIGNFETAGAPDAMVRAYGRLMAWKLGLHDVNAASTVTINGRRFAAVSGHRDAGSTACPGRNLYAKLPQIRSLARAAQTSGGGGDPTPPTPPTPPPPPTEPPISSTPKVDSQLIGNKHSDIAVRRGSDNRMLIVQTAGGTKFAAPRALKRTWPSSATVLVSPDLTGDGRPDLVAVSGGKAAIHPGNANGFGAVSRTVDGFAGLDVVRAAGDLNGDGRHDLVGRNARNGRMYAFLGATGGGLVKTQIGTGWGTYAQVAALGDVDGDGYADLMGRDTQGRLFLHRASTPQSARSARMVARREVTGATGSATGLVGVGDVNKDGRPEVLVRRGGQDYLHTVGRGGALGPAYGPVGGLSGLGALSGLTEGADLDGDGWGDLLARRGSAVVVVPHARTTETLPPVETDLDLTGANLLVNTGDFDGDGKGDVVARQGSGVLNLFRGDGKGGFSARTRLAEDFGGVTGLRSVGDVTGDGKADLMGTRGGTHYVWPGRGNGTLAAPRKAPSGLVAYFATPGIDLSGYDAALSIADLNLSGKPDLLLVDRGAKQMWSRHRTRGDSYDPRRLLTVWSGTWNLVG